MHASSNDYIYIDLLNGSVELKNLLFNKNSPYNVARLAVALSDRHKSIGSDGIIVIDKSTKADCKMHIFNKDGSLGLTCGNGLRSIAKYLYDNKITGEQISIETNCSITKVTVTAENNTAKLVTVNMGKADFNVSSLPFIFSQKTCINQPITLLNDVFYVTALSVGNPHLVVLCENIKSLNIKKLSAEITKQLNFPNGVNIEYVQKCKGYYAIRVFERGSGETLSCGSGAVATCFALVKNKLEKTNNTIKLKLRGGDLSVKIINKEAFLTGDAHFVYEGNIILKEIDFDSK